MSELDCKCKPIEDEPGLRVCYDNSSCPTHGPDAPRFFVDHGTIHDRVTGKHVEMQEAADLLSVEPEALQRIAWGTVIKLGAMLKNVEAERDAKTVALRRADGDISALVTRCSELIAQRDTALTRLERAERERDEALATAEADRKYAEDMRGAYVATDRRLDEAATQRDAAVAELVEVKAAFNREFLTGAEYQRLWAVETKRAESAERQLAECRAELSEVSSTRDQHAEVIRHISIVQEPDDAVVRGLQLLREHFVDDGHNWMDKPTWEADIEAAEAWLEQARAARGSKGE